jgi:cyclophilin family peptidyl-prolyl cis-trans isomerase
MITYAKPGHPNSRTTQLFINYKDNGYLDAQGFSPFGEVIEGMDTVDKFYHGYGDTDQGALAAGGKAYWEKQYPKFDSIKTAVIVVDTPAPTPAKAPAAATKAPAKATDKK